MTRAKLITFLLILLTPIANACERGGETASGDESQEISPDGTTTEDDQPGEENDPEETLSSDCAVKTLTASAYFTDATLSGSTLSFELPYGADLTAVALEASLPDGATSEPDLSEPVDLTGPVSLTVTAEDKVSKARYTVTASLLSQETGVRGVYLPSPSHTTSFRSYANVRSSIDLLAELNFNCIFVCGWAQTKTAWDSEVLLENTTYSSASEGNMYSSYYSGGSGDALADIIEVAHSRNIRVVLWLEYGFMHATGGVTTSDPLLAKHPDWIGINSDGGYSNYNGTDYYLNAYSPDVQEFLLSLMEEAIDKYPDLDGIQGDDRLPAMPRNSGYDSVTKALYAEDTGSEPPSDYNDTDWVQWRLDNLNAFARTMYSRLKAKKEDIAVCFAPNKYPWCENQLMQDWPQWLADGVVDLLTVQFYVTATYENDIDSALEYVGRNTDRNVLNPAMILKNGDAILTKKLLLEELRYNRSKGTCGESQFWFDGLKTDYVRDVFRGIYAGEAIYPL